MKILVTAFTPFGDYEINSSLETLRLLPKHIKNHKIIKLELPTVAYKCIELTEKYIQKYNPDIVISLGQAPSNYIRVEKIGININDFKIEDNEGNIYNGTKILDGPDAYFTEIEVKKIVDNLNNKGINSKISYTAGTYVCNHLLYGVSHLLKTKYLGKKNCFIHIPIFSEENMKQEEILNAIIYVIESI